MFKMIGGRSIQFRRQSRAAGKRELIGMHAQAESMTSRGGKDLPGFISREDVLFTKYVAVLRESFFRDAR